MKLVSVFLVVLFSFSLIAGEWVAVTRSEEKVAQRVLVTDDDSELVVDFKVPGFQAEEKVIDGKSYTSISLEGTSVYLEKGAPELRKLTAFIEVPPCSSVNARIVGQESVVIKTNPIVPSKGNILRNVMPEDVAYEFGKAYSQRGVYPTDAEIVKVSAPFQMRNVWGVQVSVTPFQYNNAEGTLKVYSNLSVAFTPVGVKTVRSTACRSSHFEKLYADLFLNHREQDEAVVEANLQAPADVKKLLIIAYDEFFDACQPLKTWKVQQGYQTELVKVSEAGATAADIKAYLQQKYDAGELCFVTLVGDSNHIPTLKGKKENADSDPCYVKLAGDDNVLDAFICRISVENVEQLEYIVQKTIHYEQYPMQGADGEWYKNTLAIASAQGSPKDFERTDELNKALADTLGFTATTCYDTTSWGGANKQIAVDAINAGTNIIDYCGHGSTTSWGTSGFSNSDCAKLTNGMKLPVIWSVACVNGSYVNKTCFAEAWLRAGTKDAPAGCIGIAAATTNMAWVPPCVWQKEIIVEQTCKKLHDVFGVQHLYGILKCMEEYGVDDKSDGNMLSEQTHYFGEGTVALRTEAAKRVSADFDCNGTTLNVTTEPGAAVTAYNDNYEAMITTVADANGNATLNVNGQTMFSVTGRTIEPVLDIVF
jgi:hypothetical protein